MDSGLLASLGTRNDSAARLRATARQSRANRSIPNRVMIPNLYMIRVTSQITKGPAPRISAPRVPALMRRTRARPPLHLRRPGRDGGKHERDDHVVAGEREPEKAPGRLVTTHHRDRLQLVEQTAGGAEIVERARAFLRARPPLPFDAGMIDAETGVPQHAEGDGGERGDEHLARGADLVAERHHDRERDREIIGVTLLEAERARLEAEPVLEEPGAQDGHRADERDGQRRGRDRAGPDHVRCHRAHARITIVKKTTIRPRPPSLSAHIAGGRPQWYGGRR